MDSNREIQQVNNFVIFDGFFTKRPDSDFIHNKRNTNSIKPADYPGSGWLMVTFFHGPVVIALGFKSHLHM
jgi:hypothetical protein